MSADSYAVVQANSSDDCSAQPPTDDGVAAAAASSAASHAPPSMNRAAEQMYLPDSTTMLEGDETMNNVPDRTFKIEKALLKAEIIIKEEIVIKEEVIDLGCGDKTIQLNVNPPKVGFDRGLEPDHVVGAMKKDGKLMFLIAWKNGVKADADLLDAEEIYERCPQIAIEFFEKHLVCDNNDQNED